MLNTGTIASKYRVIDESDILGQTLNNSNSKCVILTFNDLCSIKINKIEQTLSKSAFGM